MNGRQLSRFNLRTWPAWSAAIALSMTLVAACGGQPSATQTSAPVATVAQPTVAATSVAPVTATSEMPATTEPTVTIVASTATAEQTAQPPVSVATCDASKQTPAQTEGPYYKANTPERASLFEAGMQGTKLTVTGYVFATDCKPIAHAMLDFWQADASGNYDNSGYRLRGHLFTDSEGKFTLETIVPGLYPGRTGHIHVKVQAPSGPILTTQLYFPGEPSNDSDSIFDSRLLMNVQNTANGEVATFNFVIAAA